MFIEDFYLFILSCDRVIGYGFGGYFVKDLLKKSGFTWKDGVWIGTSAGVLRFIAWMKNTDKISGKFKIVFDDVPSDLDGRYIKLVLDYFADVVSVRFETLLTGAIAEDLKKIIENDDKT